jgi:GPH family glycoside/pentoside/hexuronide:cation symporter
MWWVPTGWSKEAQGGWLIVTMMLYFTAFSTWYVPYAAFGIEVVRGNEPERLRLNGAINALGLFAGVPMGWLYWCCQRPIFHNPVEGMRYVGLIFGVLIGACALIPALIYREPPDLILQEETKPSAQVMKLGELLRIRPFQMLILCYFAMIFGFATVAQLGFYVVSYDGCRGDVRMGSYILGIASTVSGLLGGVAAPAIAASAGRFGRRQVLFPCLAIGTLGNLSLLWSITPSDIYLYVVSWIFTSFAIWGFWTIIPALLGSVSDDIERETGKACQGLISAVAGVSGKIAVSGSFMLTGVIMVVCGYDVKLTQAELVEPLLRMRLIYAVLPCLGLIIVAVAAWFCRVSTSAGEVVPAKPAA